jgi:hypothetical protein
MKLPFESLARDAARLKERHFVNVTLQVIQVLANRF